MVVVSAAASNFKREGPITSVGKILSKASSVDAAIEMVKKGEIQGPISYLVGDRNTIAIVEVIDGKQNAFLARQEGVLSHTNHFILKETMPLNPKVGVSSQTRLNRIEKVLSGKSIHKGRIHCFYEGPRKRAGNNSICRHNEGEGDQASGLSPQPSSICQKRALLKYGWPWASLVRRPLKNAKKLADTLRKKPIGHGNPGHF